MADRIALVTGATGFIGQRLVPALVERGWVVTACGRRPRPEEFPARVKYQSVDLTGDDDLARFVYMSSSSIYGEEIPLPIPVEEEDEPNPTRPYGKAKLATEAVVWEAADQGVPVVVMRPVSVFGPGN